MVRPDKVDEMLAIRPTSRGWYQREENLATNGLIGPFNFATIDKEQHRIEPKLWAKLLEQAAEYNIEATDINKIIPLG
jgi:hypothetical protein